MRRLFVYGLVLWVCLLGGFSSAFANYHLTQLGATEWNGTKADRLQAEVPGSYQFDYGDEATASFTLPWDFPFYDVNYTQMTADSNGTIWFGTPGSGPHITVWDADLNSYYWGGVFVEHKTAPERVVIQWRTESFEQAGYYELIDVEAVLFSDGSINLNYPAIPVENSFLLACGIFKGDGTSLLLNSLTSLPNGAASFEISVPVNQAPTATSAGITTAEDMLSAGVSPSVADPDVGDTHIFSIEAQPTNGTASVVANQLVYTPNANFNGNDSFTYRATDSGGLFVIGTASVTVTPVNDAPVASNGTGTLEEGSALNGTLPAGTDVDGDSLSYALVSDASHGSAVVNSNGSYSYAPNVNFNGADSFSYKVNDGMVDSNVATMNIAVTPLISVPTITNVQVNPQEIEATITWTTDVPASSRVEYGETAAYGTAVEDLTEVTTHSVTITGLTTDMLYHYRVSSANGAGTAQTPTDLTFMTTSGVAPGAVVSDDFSAASLNTSLWRLYDPVGDAVVGLVGTGTSDARLSFFVPAGADHVPSTVDSAPRLLQLVADSDFSVVMKVDSSLSEGQGVGLMVQQDDNNWLYFDIMESGAVIYATSAGKSSGVMDSKFIVAATQTGIPFYLKVERSGQQWTQFYSVDGSTWTVAGSFSQALNVAELGPVVGTFSALGSNAPAFTALIDYLFNSTSPISPEDGGAIQSWPVTTSVSGNGSVVVNPAGGSYAEGTVVNVTAIPDPGWVFSSWSGDLSGNSNSESLLVDGAKSLAATFVPQLSIPTISAVQASPQEIEATLIWTTDVPASSRVEYGETAAYGTAVEDLTEVTTHSVTITGLTTDMLYHYRVSSANGAGTAQTPTDLTFMTTGGVAPGAVAPGAVVSDDFSAASLNTSLWRLYDPMGDSVVSLIGSGTTNALLRIAVPSGIAHAPSWMDSAPRLLQTVADTDFSVVLKFDSSSADGQGQGLIVQQDDNTWLYFDLHMTGSVVYAGAAAKSNGSMNSKINVAVTEVNTPPYLKVDRSGQQWTQSYSTDGVSWTVAGTFNHALNMTELGPVAETLALPGALGPANTVLVDYVFNSNSPIVPEDGQ